MQAVSCQMDSQCGFLYVCENQVCIHDDILPLSTYTIIIYLASGFAAGLCNVSGNSMGIFKMLILIILLKYNLDEATGLAQAMVVGTAIPNFISVILKKHPTKPTTLVNYKLLYIIIPCSLMGSTVGALGQTLIPKLGQIILNVLIFIFFAHIFIKKLRETGKELSPILQEKEKSLMTSSDSISVHNLVDKLVINQHEKSIKANILQYELSHHFKDIVFTFTIFLVFQSLSFLVQGKLPFYHVSKCSFLFSIGLLGLLGVNLIYLFFCFQKMKITFSLYKKIGISQDIYLDKYKQFLLISAGAFLAGLIQGILGLGCGTCIMMVLLSFPIHPTVASATSGYQILFTGSASLLQYYLNGEVQFFESAWMLSVCLTVGGITTLALYQILKRLNQVYVNRFLFTIIVFLCLMSIGLSVPTVLNILDKQGWEGLIKITFKC